MKCFKEIDKITERLWKFYNSFKIHALNISR